jgi:3-oxoacyl-[acyl-carrier protein] reductase
MRRLVDTAVGKLGGLDIVVNNAGVFFAHRLDEVDYAEWQEAWSHTVGLNLTAAANICYCAARVMMEGGWANCECIVSWGVSWRAGGPGIWGE